MFIALGVVSLVIIFAFVALYAYFARIHFLVMAASRDVRIYKVDIDRKLVRRDEHEKIRSIQPLRSSYAFSNDWEQLDYLSSWLRGSDGETLFQQAIIDLSRKPQHYTFTFKSLLPAVKRLRKHYFNVTFDFNLADDGLYTLVVNWKIPTTAKPQASMEIRNVTRSELDAAKMPATGYVAFNVRKKTDAATKLLKMVSTIIRKPLMSFTAVGLLVLVFQAKNVRQVERDIERFIALFEKRAIQLGAQQLYDGSAYTFAEGAHTLSGQNKSLQSLEFFVNVSIDKRANFVAITNREFRIDDYKAFSEGLKLFKNAVRERDVQLTVAAIKRYHSNRKIVDLIVPEVKGLSSHILENILRNINNKQELTDAAATQIARMRKSDMALVDVTEMWLANNLDAITNKQAIYIIELEERSDLEAIQKMVEPLRAKGFAFGLRINVFDDSLPLAITRIKPMYIIIDRTLTMSGNILDSDTYVGLITMARLAKQEDVKIIYEKPSDTIDDYTAEKIGLQYYY